MQLLESPIFPYPDHPGQIELLVSLETVEYNLGPVGADPHVRVNLGDFLDWWQLWLQFRWHLEEQHDSAPLIPRELFD